MVSGVSHFNVLLIVRGKVSIKTTTFEGKDAPKRGIEPTSVRHMHTARPKQPLDFGTYRKVKGRRKARSLVVESHNYGCVDDPMAQ